MRTLPKRLINTVFMSKKHESWLPCEYGGKLSSRKTIKTKIREVRTKDLHALIYYPGHNNAKIIS